MSSSFFLLRLVTKDKIGRTTRETLAFSKYADEIKEADRKAKLLHDGIGEIKISKALLEPNLTTCKICRGDLSFTDGVYHCENCS